MYRGPNHRVDTMRTDRRNTPSSSAHRLADVFRTSESPKRSTASKRVKPGSDRRAVARNGITYAQDIVTVNGKITFPAHEGNSKVLVTEDTATDCERRLAA